MKKYKNRKNFCSRLYKKEHKKYFNTLDVNKITGNKALWKNIQPLFSEKKKFANKTTLEDSEENISDDTLVLQELKNFFQNATKALNINENSYIVDSSSSITDPLDKAINTYKNHPSVLLMKQKLENVDHFLSLIEKREKVLDNKEYSGVILTTLSKALRTINHDLLIAKLHVYGFSKESSKLIKSYLTNRWQRIKLMLILGHKYERVLTNMDSCKIWEANDQKIFLVNIDRNLKLKHYTLKQCKKSGRKVSALTRTCTFMSYERQRVLLNFFNKSQFLLELSIIMDVL